VIFLQKNKKIARAALFSYAQCHSFNLIQAKTYEINEGASSLLFASPSHFALKILEQK
jgi:hypothetical protein